MEPCPVHDADSPSSPYLCQVSASFTGMHQPARWAPPFSASALQAEFPTHTHATARVPLLPGTFILSYLLNWMIKIPRDSAPPPSACLRVPRPPVLALVTPVMQNVLMFSCLPQALEHTGLFSLIPLPPGSPVRMQLRQAACSEHLSW